LECKVVLRDLRHIFDHGNKIKAISTRTCCWATHKIALYLNVTDDIWDGFNKIISRCEGEKDEGMERKLVTAAVKLYMEENVL